MSDFQDPKQAFPELEEPNVVVSVDPEGDVSVKPTEKPESNLVKHARRELELAGWFDEDSDYNGMAAQAVMALMGVFAKQGHSGTSAWLVRDCFHRLSNFEALTPLTDDPQDWEDVGEGVWQSRRNSTMFSTDGGKTFSEYGQGQVFTSVEHKA